MISDEMLRNAAAEAGDALMRSLPPDNLCVYPCSERHKRTAARLYRRANHPHLYRMRNRAAGILLALFLTSAVWLSVDARAREAVFGWIRDAYETFFVYRYAGGTPADAKPSDYQPTALPPDWVEVDRLLEETSATVVYRDTNGRLNYFTYTISTSDPVVVVETAEPIAVTVGETQAEYYPSNAENESNTLIWEQDGTILILSAHLPQEQMIWIAENMK